MQKALKEGPEIVVATPGRMIEMIKLKATNMRRCTMMVRKGGGVGAHNRHRRRHRGWVERHARFFLGRS